MGSTLDVPSNFHKNTQDYSDILAVIIQINTNAEILRQVVYNAVNPYKFNNAEL